MFFGVPKGRTGWMVIRCSMSSMNPAVPGVFALQVGQRRDQLRVAGRLDDLVERHVLAGEHRGVDEHLQLPVRLAEGGHVAHAGQAEQLGHDHPPGGHRHVDHGPLPGSEPDEHHVAGRGDRLHHDGRLGHVRQHERSGQPLLHELPRRVQVGAGAKCSSMSDSPSIESLVTSVTSSTPSRRFFSSGVVTSDSTSGADRPGASVWTSTVTGDVSGSTSVGMRDSCKDPEHHDHGGQRDHQQPEPDTGIDD